MGGLMPCRAAAAAAVTAALLGAAPAAAGGFYYRAGVGLDWTEETRFVDRDCSSQTAAALYGCGEGSGGAPRGSAGDYGTTPGIELGAGRGLTSFFRVEAVAQYRPGLDFRGRSNFSQTRGIQAVSAGLSSLSGLVAAYVQVPGLGAAAPFAGGGVGLARIAIGDTRMRFRKTTTIVPGGRRLNRVRMATAGLAVTLCEWMALDLAWRWTDSGEVETGRGKGRIVWRDGSRDPVELDLAETWAELSSQGLRASVRCAF